MNSRSLTRKKLDNLLKYKYKYKVTVEKKQEK